MSIRVMSRVWKSSRAKGGELLVLLGIADHADDHGYAFPSVSTLAQKARLTVRQVQRVLKQLVARGELQIQKGKGPHGCHLFLVANCPGDNLSQVTSASLRGDIRDATGVTSVSPEPSNRNINKSSMGTSLERDALIIRFWDAYPARNGKKLEKDETERRFNKLSDEDQELAIKAATHYAASAQVREGIGIRDPKRFIRDGKGNEPWRDWLEPEQPKAARINGNGAAKTCTKRVRHQGDQFLRACGQPAVKGNGAGEPRCAEHAQQGTAHA